MKKDGKGAKNIEPYEMGPCWETAASNLNMEKKQIRTSPYKSISFNILWNDFKYTKITVYINSTRFRNDLYKLKFSILYRRVSGVEIFQNSYYICKREYKLLVKNNKYPCRLISISYIHLFAVFNCEGGSPPYETTARRCNDSLTIIGIEKLSLRKSPYP